MNKDVLKSCLEMLESMPTGREQDAKWDALRKLYILALTQMEDKEGQQAVTHAALNESWRPSPARLMEIAADLASPTPDAETAYAEIVTLVATEGLYAAPHPDRPSIKIEGPPPFSHPLVDAIVRYCGGWPMICSGEANMAEGLRKQVRSAHESLTREWREKVKYQLGIPAARRDIRLFPKWKPFDVGGAWLDPLALEEMYRFDSGQIVEKPQPGQIPAEVRRMIEGVKSVPAVNHVNSPPIERSADRPPFTHSERVKTEAELAAHYNAVAEDGKAARTGGRE